MFKKICHGVYNFIATPRDRGIGAENMAMLRPYQPPLDMPIDGRHAVRRSFAITEPGYVKMQQMLVPASLLGDGTMMHGDLHQSPLFETEGG